MKLQTINVYVIYNVFRYADQLAIGEDDVVLTNVVKYDLVSRLMTCAL